MSEPKNFVQVEYPSDYRREGEQEIHEQGASSLHEFHQQHGGNQENDDKEKYQGQEMQEIHERHIGREEDAANEEHEEHGAHKELGEHRIQEEYGDHKGHKEHGEHKGHEEEHGDHHHHHPKYLVHPEGHHDAATPQWAQILAEIAVFFMPLLFIGVIVITGIEYYSPETFESISQPLCPNGICSANMPYLEIDGAGSVSGMSVSYYTKYTYNYNNTLNPDVNINNQDK